MVRDLRKFRTCGVLRRSEVDQSFGMIRAVLQDESRATGQPLSKFEFLQALLQLLYELQFRTNSNSGSARPALHRENSHRGRWILAGELWLPALYVPFLDVHLKTAIHDRNSISEIKPINLGES